MCVCVGGGGRGVRIPAASRGRPGARRLTFDDVFLRREPRGPPQQLYQWRRDMVRVGRREEGGEEEKGAAQSPHPTPRRSFDSPGRTPRVRKRPEAAAVVSPSPCPSPTFQRPKINLGDSQNFSQKCFGFFDNISIGSIDGNGSATGRSRALLKGGRGGGPAEASEQSRRGRAIEVGRASDGSDGGEIRENGGAHGKGFGALRPRRGDVSPGLGGGLRARRGRLQGEGRHRLRDGHDQEPRGEPGARAAQHPRRARRCAFRLHSFGRRVVPSATDPPHRTLSYSLSLSRPRKPRRTELGSNLLKAFGPLIQTDGTQNQLPAVGLPELRGSGGGGR